MQAYRSSMALVMAGVNGGGAGQAVNQARFEGGEVANSSPTATAIERRQVFSGANSGIGEVACRSYQPGMHAQAAG